MIGVRFKILLAGSLRVMAAMPVRSALTIAAVAVATAALVGLMAVGEGTRRVEAQRVASLGHDLLFVTPIAGTLRVEDAEALLDDARAPDIGLVAPEIVLSGHAAAQDFEVEVTIIGTTPEYFVQRDLRLRTGRYLHELDVLGASAVGVIGESARELSLRTVARRGVPAVLNRRPLTVVGFLERQAGGANAALDRSAIVPLTTAQLRFAAPGAGLTRITAQIVPGGSLEAAKEQALEVLEHRHGRRDFAVVTQDELRTELRSATYVPRNWLLALSGATIGLAAIAVANLAFSWASDRRLELDVRRAVGARRRDIVRQLVGEAVVLAFVGGVLGTALGLGGTALFDRLTVAEVTFSTPVRFYVVPMAAAVAVGIGIIGALYPAYRASRTMPIGAV